MPRLSEAQIEQARSMDLLDYLQTYEPHNVRKSKGRANQHEMVEHDSLKMSNGKWYRHSQGVGGYSALDFLVKIRGVHFVDAVLSLTGGYAIPPEQDMTASKARPPPKPPSKPKPFTLPKPNRNADRVVAYLRGRGISKTVINRCILAGLLYENDKHRCVFVGKDGDKAKFACERGTADDTKKDVAGSDKRFSFTLPPENPNGSNTLAVFESPIDSLAHFSIHEMGQTEWDGHRLSLGGVSSLALISFLERNPDITNIQLCLDSDKAGKEATQRIIGELLSDKRFSDKTIIVAPPPIGKDYADTLKAIQQLHMEKSKTTYRQNEK
ncbi:MAG: DUF3991 and toprim domain-containing protein [Defluviitaleaceae bacterium]|nr:DUF3991 and toprim domain-containing protein [Defluviitaleaceae bacterium]